MVFVAKIEEKQESAKTSATATVEATAKTVTEIATAPANPPSAKAIAETANSTTTEAINLPATAATTEAEATNSTTTEAVDLPATATTAEAANSITRTTIPPSPSLVIQSNKQNWPSANNIVTIDPHCFYCAGRTELDPTMYKNKSINMIVNSIVKNNLSPEQRACALQHSTSSCESTY